MIDASKFMWSCDEAHCLIFFLTFSNVFVLNCKMYLSQTGDRCEQVYVVLRRGSLFNIFLDLFKCICLKLQNVFVSNRWLMRVSLCGLVTRLTFGNGSTQLSVSWFLSINIFGEKITMIELGKHYDDRIATRLTFTNGWT